MKYQPFLYPFAFILALVTLECSGSEIVHQSETEPEEEQITAPVFKDELTVLPSNSNKTSREARQLISLLKSFLKAPNEQNSQLQSPIQQNQYQDYPPKPQPQYQQQQNAYETQTQYPGGFYHPAAVEQKIHSANTINANYQQQYPMLNYPSQQHAAVPFYNDNLQQQKTQQSFLSNANNGMGLLGGGNGGGLAPSNPNPLLTLLTSALGGGGVAAAGGNANNLKIGSMLSKLGLGLPEDLDLAGLINFGSLEGMLGRVNHFDKLQCIPRMICQLVAKRNEDAKLRDSTSTTTTTTTTTTQRTTRKPKGRKKKSREESGRFIKINGADTALDQFVKFLEMMQLKDWSIYPYVKGMYEGNQVSRAAECAQKFYSCPFSEDQLVYYFNNYNGGFFQSFRNGRNLNGTLISTD